MRSVKRVSVSVLAFVVSVHLHAGDGLATVCVDAANPPFMSLLEGKASGLYPTLITTALNVAGVGVRVTAKPWKRCIADMDSGAAGVGGIYKNEDRIKRYDFSDPIFVEKMAVYFLDSQPLEFSGVDSLVGRRVGVVRGWSYGDAFDKAVRDGKISVEEVSADANNFQKLLAKRINVVLAIEEAGTALLKAGQWQQVQKSPRYLFENPTYLAFNKSAAQTDTLGKFNKVIADMKKSGQLNALAAAELGK